jgi:hypothetical protein
MRQAEGVTEIGFDIRNDSHCGAGAPRFNIQTTTGKSYFLGCNSPAPTTTTPGTDWTRRRWADPAGVQAYNASTSALEAITDPIKSISIVFDEPGLAVLDNVDLNGTMVGSE